MIKFPKFSAEVRLQPQSPPFASPPTLIPPSAATGPNQSTPMCLCPCCRWIVVEFKKNENKTMDWSSKPKLNVPDSPVSSTENNSDVGHNEYPNDSDYRYELGRVDMNNDSKLVIKRINVKKIKRL